MNNEHSNMSRHVRRPRFFHSRLSAILTVVLGASMGLASLNACNSTPPDDDPPIDNPKNPNKPDKERPMDRDETYGELCETSSECESEFCSRLNDTSDDAFCSYKCSEDGDCPQTDDLRSSCIFALVDNKLAQICAPDDLCIDRDEDGYGSGPGCLGQDCDDDNPAIHPGADEICDGLDNNCDGLIDVNIEGFGGKCDTNLFGECATGVRVCEQGRELCNAVVRPGEKQEICDGLDNDCDGEIDEGPIYPGEEGYENSDGNYIPRLNEPCGPDGDDSCFEGILVCNSESKTLLCELTSSNETDTPDDTCDYIDDNCNGRIDEDYWDHWEDEANQSQWDLGGGTVVSYKRNARCTIGFGACKREGFVDCPSGANTDPPQCNAEVVQPEAGVVDICNYFDDDCDGIIDNGFAQNLQWDDASHSYKTVSDTAACSDSNNCKRVYNSVTSCDSCATNCNNQFGAGVDPASLHVQPTCELENETFKANCSFDCLPGYVDFDGLLENGCEFKPDTSAIYVASADRGGKDDSSCGTYDKPCASITHGLSRAKTASKTSVLVGEGTFTGGFTIDSSIKLIGGHSSQNWLREKDDNGTLLNTTALRGGANEGIDSYAVRILNINGSKSVEFSGFSIEAPDAKEDSGNAIGIWVINGDNHVTVSENTVFGGRGGTGKPGTEGADGAGGKDGKAGNDRLNGQTSCTDGLAGGAGGAGTCGNAGGAGAATNCPVANAFTAIGPNDGRAANGQGNSTNNGTGGRSPHHYQLQEPEHGVYGCVVDPNNPVPSPEPGGNGSQGTDGVRGLGATNATGSISGNSWRGISGGNGNAGESGGGGGGGGSSGGIRQNVTGAANVYHYGATGGGGGGGGCGATGGNGGQAGGGSFGILIVGTQSSLPVVADNVLHRGTGGRGGQGGIGGVGGDGGAGGVGGKHKTTTEWSRCGQHAANGGDGGRGGHGGGAGGGAGGIAFDIVISGYSGQNLPSSNTFTIPDSQKTGGAGGNGGSGILSSGTAGVQGESGSVKRF